MRIATLCFSATVGGLELATLRQGAELQRRGHHVTAIIPKSEPLAAQAAGLGLRVEQITPHLPYLDPLAARRVRAVVRRERVDAIIVGRTRDLSTAMLGAGSDVAVVLYQQMQFGHDKHDWFHDRIMRRLDACIAITTRTAEQMIAHTAIDPAIVAFVPYGIDTERFAADRIDREAARATFGLPHDAFAVGIVGGFNPGKGQREFIAALDLAAERLPELRERLHGVLVGERAGDDPGYIAELRALREASPLAGRISLHPFSNDPRTAYRAFDLFVLASYSETFGMVLQEAMAMGAPVIATDAGGVPEIVQHGANGLLVPPHDASAIADAIVELARRPELRETLAEHARVFVVQHYDHERQSTAFERVVREAVAVRRSRLER